MTRQSSQTVTYRDLLHLAERSLAEAEKKLRGAKACGAFSVEGITHEVESWKRLVKMLKKGLPVKQTDLFALFEETR